MSSRDRQVTLPTGVAVWCSGCRKSGACLGQCRTLLTVMVDPIDGSTSGSGPERGLLEERRGIEADFGVTVLTNGCLTMIICTHN